MKKSKPNNFDSIDEDKTLVDLLPQEVLDTKDMLWKASSYIYKCRCRRDNYTGWINITDTFFANENWVATHDTILPEGTTDLDRGSSYLFSALNIRFAIWQRVINLREDFYSAKRERNSLKNKFDVEGVKDKSCQSRYGSWACVSGWASSRTRRRIPYQPSNFE